MAKTSIWILALATIGGAYAIAEPLEGEEERDGALIFEPFVEVKFTITDNVNLSPKGQRRSGEAFTLGGGFDASYRSRRIEGEAHLLVEGDRFLTSEFNNPLRALFDGTVTAEIIPNHGYLDIGVGWEQVIVDPLGRVSLNPIAAAGNSDGVGTVFVSPVFRSRLTNWADAEVRLTHGRTFSADDGLDNSQTNTASLIVASTQSSQNFGFEGQLEYSDFDSKTPGGFNDVERATAFLTTSYNINRNVALLARGGYDSIDSRAFREDPDGIIAMGGVRLSAGRASQLQILAGQRYNDLAVEANLNLRLTRNFALGATFANGIGTGSQSQFSQLIGRFFKAQGITGKAPELQLLAVERLINRDSRVIEEGFGAINQAYKQQVASVFGRADFQHDEVFINAYYQKRDFDILNPLDPSIDDTGLTASASWKHEFTPRLESETAIFYQRYETDSPILSDTDTVGASAGLSFKITPNVKASATVIHTERKATFSRDEYKENAVVFGLRATF